MPSKGVFIIVGKRGDVEKIQKKRDGTRFVEIPESWSDEIEYARLYELKKIRD
jgi:hypothetical protein